MKLYISIKFCKIIFFFSLFYFFFSLSLFNCSFKKNFLNAKSKRCNIDKGILSKEDKLNIVQIHNNLRNQVAIQKTKIGPMLPFATNMIQMYYSESLGAKAQEWADKCTFQHSDQNFRKQLQFEVGENIYRVKNLTGFSKKNWKEAIESWFNEIKFFGGNSVTQYNDKQNTRNFSQMIWANSYFIGCGFSSFIDGPNSFISLYVCHYGPKAAIPGMSVYNGSLTLGCKCPYNFDCNNLTYTGLCCPYGHCNRDVLEYNGKQYTGTGTVLP